jgi:hypothetical protein
MVYASYNCTQQQAYNTCRFAWRACQQNLLSFADYKSNYTLAFIAENLDAIDAADALDDHKARYSTTKQLYVALTDEKDNVIDLYVYLKGYIVTAYAENIRDIVIEEAGQQYFAGANTGKWASVTGLLSAMLPFVFKNEAILIEKGFAPKNFLTRVQETKQRFDAVYKTYKEEEDSAANATEEKVVATNDVCAKVLDMLADAKIVFRRDETNAKKFIWNYFLSQTRGSKNAGLAGFVRDKETNKGIEKAEVFIVGTDKIVTTDKEGRFDFSPLNPAEYILQFSASGYTTVVSDKKMVKSSVVGRINVDMMAAVAQGVLPQNARG